MVVEWDLWKGKEFLMMDEWLEVLIGFVMKMNGVEGMGWDEGIKMMVRLEELDGGVDCVMMKWEEDDG